MALLTETQLLDGYQQPAPVDRIVRCACGDTLRAERNDSYAVMAAVVRHNESALHRSWRIARELV